MSEFSVFYHMGINHILDIMGIDHILFLIALVVLFHPTDWKKILLLVTAFTIGHSITLALATFNFIEINFSLIEFLIPLTILITALSNLFALNKNLSKSKVSRNYFFALFFGTIHGMGFSNYLRALLGTDQTIILQLLAFNIGIEIGQIIIVSIFLGIGFISIIYLKISQRDWRMIISSAAAGVASYLLLMSDMI